MDGQRGRVENEGRPGPNRGTAPVGARTPEELETLLEDALLMRDGALLAALFEHGAALVAGDGAPVRGGGAVAGLALALWEGDRTYVANPQRVVQAGDLALIVAERSISVARRDRAGDWRYVIAAVSPGDTPPRRDHGAA